MIAHDHMDEYCRLMKEVKMRCKVIEQIGNKKLHLIYDQTTIESLYLQFRKVLESIALGSLLAHQEKYQELKSDIHHLWKASSIITKLKRINPDFYPQPIIQEPRSGIVTAEFVPRKSDYLTQEEFIKVYDKCSKAIHVMNPFQGTGKLNFNESLQESSQWYVHIINLLNSHLIKPVGDQDMYLIQMGKQNKDPTWTYWKQFRAAPS